MTFGIQEYYHHRLCILFSAGAPESLRRFFTFVTSLAHCHSLGERRARRKEASSNAKAM
jgi:hypothetical protein